MDNNLVATQLTTSSDGFLVLRRPPLVPPHTFACPPSIEQDFANAEHLPLLLRHLRRRHRVLHHLLVQVVRLVGVVN